MVSERVGREGIEGIQDPARFNMFFKQVNNISQCTRSLNPHSMSQYVSATMIQSCMYTHRHKAFVIIPPSVSRDSGACLKISQLKQHNCHHHPSPDPFHSKNPFDIQAFSCWYTRNERSAEQTATNITVEFSRELMALQKTITAIIALSKT